MEKDDEARAIEEREQSKLEVKLIDLRLEGNKFRAAAQHFVVGTGFFACQTIQFIEVLPISQQLKHTCQSGKHTMAGNLRRLMFQCRL